MNDKTQGILDGLVTDGCIDSYEVVNEDDAHFIPTTDELITRTEQLIALLEDPDNTDPVVLDSEDLPYLREELRRLCDDNID